MHKKLLTLLCFCLALCEVNGNEIKITTIRGGAEFNPEFNRAFNYCWNFDCYGGIEFNRKLAFDSGFSIGKVGDEYAFNAFADGGWSLNFGRPVSFRANTAYLYNTIPEYKTDIHSIVPYSSLAWRRLDVSMGADLRFTLYDGTYIIFEPIFVFSLRYTIIDTKRLDLDICFFNLDRYLARNSNAYSLSFGSLIHLKGYIYLKNNLELLQTGSGSLAANFYGISYKGGIVFRY